MQIRSLVCVCVCARKLPRRGRRRLAWRVPPLEGCNGADCLATRPPIFCRAPPRDTERLWTAGLPLRSGQPLGGGGRLALSSPRRLSQCRGKRSIDRSLTRTLPRNLMIVHRNVMDNATVCCGASKCCCCATAAQGSAAAAWHLLRGGRRSRNEIVCWANTRNNNNNVTMSRRRRPRRA